MEARNIAMTQCDDDSRKGEFVPIQTISSHHAPVNLLQEVTHRLNVSNQSIDSSHSQNETSFLNDSQSIRSSGQSTLPPPPSRHPDISHGTPGSITATSDLSFSTKDHSSASRVSSSLDGMESSQGSEVMSPLHPPQIGTTKSSLVKRGPGRPRKDSLGTGKISKLPTGHKIKNLFGGVRGRKKLDTSNTVGGSNLASMSAGDVSGGYSPPPRGTDDTAESDTSSVASSMEKIHEEFTLFPELWPGKVCAFCSLGERSMLGQGDLLRLEVTEGFDPITAAKGLTVVRKGEKDNSVDKSQKPGLFARRQKGSGKMKRLVSQGSLESMNEPVDEVCGYADEPEYSVVFDCVLGLYYVHYNCALWCDGVEKSEDGTFQNLEIEISRAINQRCQHCGNLGAGLICKVEGCCSLLHYPCAALSGAFQDPASRSVVCFSHIESSLGIVGDAANCTVCDSKGDVSSLVMCSSCGRHYHGTCMALNSDPCIRAGWQCPACKMCQACRQPGDESKLLACDTCDKSYHIFCLRPALSSIPKHSWKCKMCRMCTDCGARTPGSGPSSRWHANFSVCDSCYQQRNKGLACPLCGKAYRHVAQKLMLQCHLCKKYVHGTCDPAADRTTYQQRKDLYPDYEYICIPCKEAGTGLNTLGGNPRVLSAIKRSGKEDLDEGISPSNFAVSQDSLISLEDDSLPGTESSNDLIWLDKCLPAPLEDIKPQLPIPPISVKDKILTPDKFHKKKIITGRIKGSEKLGQITVKHNGSKIRLNEFAKKRGPKPKLRLFGSTRVGMNRSSAETYKRDEELGVENRMVLCSARDEYVIQQDVCVMCGAFGNDFEGRLISCAQCGQCYHPFCVNVKVTKVVLLKGWRCLDCTVCEGCGQRNDESRLILCDECDVSYHIYCIDPPLERVPQGTWKCKWCAICQYCGSNDPGYNSCWHVNYTKCGPCASNNMCPVCKSGYSEGDLIIKCFQCERWLHSLCDMIKDTDDAEKCAEEGYFCILCRPTDALPPHLMPPPPVVLPKIETPPRSPELQVKTGIQFLIDGICLSENGMSHIKSLTLELPRKKRKKIPSAADREAGILAAIEAVVSREDDRVQIDANRSEEMNEKDKDAKKRQKHLQKLGIGGFLARLRGPRFREDEYEMSELNSVSVDGEKPKRKAPRRKNKNKLIETFPSYLQEAFFGKGLLEPTKDFDLVTDEDVDTDTVASLRVETTIKLTAEEIQELEAIKERHQKAELTRVNNSVSQQVQKKAEVQDSTSTKAPVPAVGVGSGGPLHDILPLSGDLLDHDLVDTIMNERNEVKAEDNLREIRRGQLETSSHLQIDQPDQNSDENGHKDELTDFLSSQFNLGSMDSGLPTMDSKDVEDIFKGVEESQENLFVINSVPIMKPQLNSTNSATVVNSGMPVSSSPSIMPVAITQSAPALGSPSIARATSVQQNLASPVSFPPPSPYHSEYSNSPQFSPAFSEPPSPWPAPSEDADQPSSYNQRSILKWEADEGLGASATISAVLYANVNHPELKRDYTNWSERSKQIAKIWRGLPSDKRAPYLQKARENRAASRMQKAQQMPKDIRGGASIKKETSQIPSPEGVQSSPKMISAPQISTGTFADSNSASSSNECSTSGTSPYATSCYSVATASNPVHSVVSYSSSGISGQQSGSFHQNVYMNTGVVSKSLSFPSQVKDECSNKYSFGDRDHLIKVLTPSEIMKSLPDLKQDDCSFTSRMDQDKLLTGGQPKTPRLETQEERHWKQMQALRQHHAQVPMQDQAIKDNVVSGHASMSPGGSHSQFPFPTGAVNPGNALLPRSGGSDSLPQNVILASDNVRQPLQVSTPHDPKLPALHSAHSPRVQSPISRPPAPLTLQQPLRPSGGKTEMPPPIPSLHFGRLPLPSSQVLRSPLYSRAPFSHPPRLPNPTHSDGYANVPSSEQSHSQTQLRAFNDADSLSATDSSHYSQNSVHEGGDIGGGNRSATSPQGQETRQHLRDLLQRQQFKKLEQDQIPPSATEGVQRLPWAHDEWQKPGAVDGNNIVRHPVGNMQSQGIQMNQFRQPFLPTHLRMSPTNAQIPIGMQPMSRPGDFRMGISGQSTTPQAVDPRARIILNQQRVIMNPMQQGGNRQQTFIGSPTTQFQQVRTAMDPYGNLISQQPRMQGGGIVTSTSSMLAQQLGRPLNSISQRIPDSVVSQISQQQNMPANQQGQNMNNTPLSDTNPITSPLQSDHQELPDSVTAELEKLEQEQHNDNNPESELADFGMDDDDLLGMGADFNILEYADPELDQVVGGEKTNILDNLDLEEEEKDENKEQKRKEESDRQPGSLNRGSKKEGIEYSSSGKPIKPKVPNPQPEQGAVQSNSTLISPSKPNFGHGSAGSMDGGAQPLLRPTQPPPPYPGPPPPYPGRPQMGIRNGCGVGVNVPPVVAVGLGAKSSITGFVGGGGPPVLQVSTLAMHSNSNPHLSLHQRRTLLLQEQPLLLEDLLEQEKREQLRQGSGLIGAAPEEPLLSDFDFERLKADVLSSSNLPVSLSPPNVVGQNVMSMPSQPSGLINRNQTLTGAEWPMGGDGNVRRQESQSVDSNSNVHSVSSHSGTPIGNPSVSGGARMSTFPLQSLPPPPNPPEHPTTEQERQMHIQYEQWLYSQQHVLGVHLKTFETEVHKLRKGKKSLNSKLRQLRKNGNDLTETDAMELERIGKELPGLQKQLDQARKQSRQHNLLIQDFRNKQQKMQQMMGMSPGPPPGSLPTLPSPLGAASSSPLHSTPQSPMLSPSPSIGGPSPSPHMQNSPMASPLTPSPGPASNSMCQMSPRGNLNSNVHILDETPFSPISDGSGRQLISQNSSATGRIQNQQHHVSHMRMGSPGVSSHQIMVSQGNMNMVNSSVNSGLMMARGMNVNMLSMNQQRPLLDNQGGMQRMRALNSQDQLRNMNQLGQRFQRIGMNQEMMMRARPPSNFSGQSQMALSPGAQLYNPVRVSFPSQSPTGSNISTSSLRSPSPMNQMGGMGSPPGNQMMMSQSRVSPASSPMRRPSGSGSIGSASPMAERPQSVENPLTPRNAGSRPLTPIGSGGLSCQNVEGISVPIQQHTGSIESQHFNATESCVLSNVGSPTGHNLQNFMPNTSEFAPNVGHVNPDYASSNLSGGGGGNPQILPFPNFSWFDQPFKLGLKGGNPFSVVSEHTPSTSNPIAQENPTAPIGQIPPNVSEVNSSQQSVPSDSVVVNSIESIESLNHTTSHHSTAIQTHTLTSGTEESPSATAASAISLQIIEVPTSSELPISSVRLPVHSGADPSSKITQMQKSQAPEVKMADLKKDTDTISALGVVKENLDTTLVQDIRLKNDLTDSESTELQVSTDESIVADESGSSKPNMLEISEHDLKTDNSQLMLPPTSGSSPHEFVSSNLILESHNIISTEASKASVLEEVNFQKFVMKENITITGSLKTSHNHTQVDTTTNTVSKDEAEKPSLLITAENSKSRVPLPTVSDKLESSIESVKPNNITETLQKSKLTLGNIGVGKATTDSQPAIDLGVREHQEVNERISGTDSRTGNLSEQLQIYQTNTITIPSSSGASETSISKLSVTDSHNENDSEQLRLSKAKTSTIPSNSAPTVTIISKTNDTDSCTRNDSEQLSQKYQTEIMSTPFNSIPTPMLNPSNLHESVQGIISVSSSKEYVRSTTEVPTFAVHKAEIPAFEGISNDNQILKSNIIVNNTDIGEHDGNSNDNQILKSNLNFVMSELVTCAELTTSTSSFIETGQAIKGSVQTPCPSASSIIVSGTTPATVQLSSQGSITSAGESQNALLKQLLQNTGCASMAQTSENVGFSLTSCLQSRPVNTVVHTSHLSEAATRIPQPTPAIRAAGTPTPVSSPSRPPIKMECNDESNGPIPEPVPKSPEEISTIQKTSDEQLNFLPQIICDESSVSQSAILGEGSNELTEGQPSEKLVLESPTSNSKKPEEEAKKAKRRQYQSKRKQSTTGKEPAAAPKKRPRKAGKPEEDFDAFIDTFMVQLRQLPPVGIVEPDLDHSYNTRSIFGVGDYSKLNTKGYTTRLGDLVGSFGQSTLNATSDYYSTNPYGRESARPPQKTSPSHRGFYNQEFASPRTTTLEKSHVENRTPTPIRDSDTPDTIVSSSSPECATRESPDMFPGLKLVETDDVKANYLRDSPTIPIVIPIPIRPLLAAKLAKAALDADKENGSTKNIFGKERGLTPFKENGNITVTLTLSATAVDDIRGVLRNLANILVIAPPAYQIYDRPNSPMDQKFFTYKTKDGKEAVDIQSILNGTAKFCKHCDVLVINNIIKKKSSDLPGYTSETSEPSNEYYFCSSNCYMQFSITHGIDVASWDKAPTVVKHISDSTVRTEIKSEKQSVAKDCRNGPVRSILQSTTRKEGPGIKVEPENKHNILKRSAVRPENEPPVKKWKGSRYKTWTSQSQNLKYKKPTEKELTEMLFRLGITAMPNKLQDDTRRCTFCHQVGDGVSDGPGRLLNFDVDKWVHLNCALWSEEVYETENGALVNVEVALKQSLSLACIICKQSGASVKCFKVRCTSVYHCGCAVKDGCSFYKNKSVYCPAHIPKGEKENELTSLAVFRRVYVQRDENRQVAVVMHHVDQHHLLRVGSLIFLNVGQLLPHQLHNFHTGNYIYPVGYKIVRFYWSMSKVNKRCQYICSIHEVDGRPEFRITAQEEGCKEHILKAGTAQGAWLQVLQAISKLRNAHDSIKIFPKYITGEDLFGLTEPAIVKVLESLPGIETLTEYHFKYGRNPLLELPLAINPSGSARSEPKLRTHFKRPHTQRTGASRTSLPSSVLSSSEAACPYSKQFVHSKSSQYKKMKQEWRNNVYLARSKIQGLGLYAARDIEKHTMVIEYIGEIIRNELAESREKKYESQNRGIYMFRMDDERVIDATLCGGLARYINHSCNPNCVAETVEVDRDVRIIIFANRRISRGEELAYDYKFEFEDDQHKIPCNCGAHNCQQWMN